MRRALASSPTGSAASPTRSAAVAALAVALLTLLALPGIAGQGHAAPGAAVESLASKASGASVAPPVAPPLALPLDDGTCLGEAPCGKITPLIDLDFPDKPQCKSDASDLGNCIRLPGVGQEATFEGTVRWYWRESEDLTYAPDPGQPIVLTFGGSATNPDWLDFDAEPPSYTIDAATLADPRNRRAVDENGVPVVYYWFERPVTVTFRQEGTPDAEGLEHVRNKGGLQRVIVRASSTASGGFFDASFGMEQFRFDAGGFLAPAQDSRGAPGLPAAALGAALAGLAAVTAGRRGRAGPTA